MSALETLLLAQAESPGGIRAGLAALADVLKGPSCQASCDGSDGPSGPGRLRRDAWPPEARTVLVLGLHHPAKNPRLDWWERGDTWGNRRLRALSAFLKRWLREAHGLGAYPLPYHLEKGGLFLKDAAALSGIGVIGRNNLLLTPEWGPRIRLRSILLEGEWQPTQPLAGFSPCDACDGYCQRACPVTAFPDGRFSRPACGRQMAGDTENKAVLGGVAESGRRHFVIQYCRACELSCPVGA